VPEMVTFADIEQWEKWFIKERKKGNKSGAILLASTAPVIEKNPEKKFDSKKRLSYKEQQEFDKMEGVIHTKEAKLAELEVQSNDPAILSNAKELTKITGEMGVLQKEIERLYSRWTELEEKTK
jgi:ATP-binding cassette subfamily F protein uup